MKLRRSKNKFLPTIAIIAVVTFGGCASQPSPDEEIDTKQRAEQQDRISAAFIETARLGIPPSNFRDVVDKALADHLRDPDSRKVEFTSNPYGGVVCGRINSKNGFGGYSGFSSFVAVFDASHHLIRTFIDGDENDIARSDWADIAIILTTKC